jgi:predicted Zn-dependent protease
MDTKEKIELANQILGAASGEDVKVLNSDRSLIERKMTEKIILTSDNRELLMG